MRSVSDTSILFQRPDPSRKRLAAALRRRRQECGQALFLAVERTHGADSLPTPSYEQLPEWSRSHLVAAVDILERWCATGDPLFLELFEGWVRSRMVADLFAAKMPSDYRPAEVVRHALAGWAEALRADCGDTDALALDLGPSIARLSQAATKELPVLFVGDCLQFEIITSLLAASGRERIAIKPTIANEKVPTLLRNRVRSLPPDGFRLVFFSPFSHAQFPDYESLLSPRAALWSPGRRSERIKNLLAEVRATVEAMAAHFECPVYVHNTAGSVQSFGRWSGLAKHVASFATRRRARLEINRGVAELLADPRTNPGGRAQLLDEDALRRTASSLALGQVHFQSGAFHPTRLGLELGRKTYFDAVYAAGHLVTKKVVVCDLDNTLWHGVIGEGAVTHHVDRQETLKELRRRGVLLSINSKNDPRNVHWTGARLEAADFVAPQINWEPKPVNIARIRDELNLKIKDFVFIDDRPDELERVQSAFPEIHVLSAERPETWRFLGHWQRSLPANPDEDRTRLYHERVHRDEFLKTGVAEAGRVEDEAAALARLELAVTIRKAGRSDLKRAVELINRTNQFNLCGTRTTLAEFQERLRTGDAVLVADASDKFGQMGMVGVMVVETKPDRVEVPVFVLSCRVFGFGIEYALLNSVRRLASAPCGLVGRFVETQSNQPCREMYPRSGLTWDGQRWVGTIAALPADPAWLAIRSHVDGPAVAATTK
ncbi:MAG TPA: HAD-IIIC family phosphatase [Gemmataceae bacterium]|jgi:FkbH-like protein|nr:HAD-IIIC family phosphatase [Gemmataceae bacterium]